MQEENAVNVDTVIDVTNEMVAQTKSIFHLDELRTYLTWANLMKIVISILTLLIFYIVYRLIKRFLLKQAKEKLEPHKSLLLSKIVSYAFYIIIGMYVLSLFGVDLGAVWGAAGVAGLAVGFAAQTSISNLISGLFVVGEKALKIGDFIAINDVMGTVDNIGLLSITIRSLDNQMIRIPNSTIINESLTNYSHFPIRRLVFTVPISYDADLRKAIEVAKTIPKKCPTVLEEPAPAIYYDGLGDDGVQMKIAVWLKGSDLFQTKTDVQIEILHSFAEAQIDIPYTHYEIELLNGVVPPKKS